MKNLKNIKNITYTNSIKDNKAITLVALVITVIILIILAGISINMLLGEGGLITKAQQAKENIELAQIEEQEKLNELYSKFNIQSSGTSIDNMDYFLENPATANKILKDYKAYVNGELITGTMKNNEPQNKSLKAGETYTIPEGYHDGTEVISAYQDVSGQSYDSNLFPNGIVGGYGYTTADERATRAREVVLLNCSYANNILSWYSNEPIDVTNLNEIRIGYAMYTNHASLTNTTYFGISDYKDTSLSNFIASETVTNTGNTIKGGTAVIDVSSVTGSHYLKICVKHGGELTANTCVTFLTSISTN